MYVHTGTRDITECTMLITCTSEHILITHYMYAYISAKTFSLSRSSITFVGFFPTFAGVFFFGAAFISVTPASGLVFGLDFFRSCSIL